MFQALADVNSTYETMNKIAKVKKPIRVINEKSLELEPLGNEVIIVVIMTLQILFTFYSTLIKFQSLVKNKIYILIFFQLLAYFAERMISGETLRRNGVMQKKAGPVQVSKSYIIFSRMMHILLSYLDILSIVHSSS